MPLHSRPYQNITVSNLVTSWFRRYRISHPIPRMPLWIIQVACVCATSQPNNTLSQIKNRGALSPLRPFQIRAKNDIQRPASVQINTYLHGIRYLAPTSVHTQ